MRRIVLSLLLVFCPLSVFAAADQKISELDAASTPAGTEVLPCVQSGATKKCTIDQLRGPGQSITGLSTNTAIAGADQLPNYSTTDGEVRKLTVSGLKNRVVTLADATTISPSANTGDVIKHVNTQSAGTLTVDNPTGSPVDGQLLTFRIKSTNAQTFAWGAAFRAGTIALPTAHAGGGDTEYYVFIYNSADSKWDYTGFAGGF
jgi:hypothetical protein